MTPGTWIVFSMTAFVFFLLGRKYQRYSDKELHRLAKEIIEEAKKHDAQKQSSGL